MGLKIALGIPLGDWRLEDDVDGNGLSDGWTENASPGDLAPNMIAGASASDNMAYPFGSGTTQRIALYAGGPTYNTGRYIQTGKSPSGYLNSGMNSTTTRLIIFATYSWEPAQAGDVWLLEFSFHKANGTVIGSGLGTSWDTNTSGTFRTDTYTYAFLWGSSDNPDYVRAKITIPQQRAGAASVLKVARIGLGVVLSVGATAIEELSTPWTHAGTRVSPSAFGETSRVAGRRLRFDPSAGRRSWRWEFAYRNLIAADTRIVRDYFRANKGNPPIASAGAAPVTWLRGAAYPLIIQPGLEEGPGFSYVDFADEELPLRPDNTWSSSLYQGTLAFEDTL